MNRIEKYTRGLLNRIFFFPYKHRFYSCGRKVLSESPFIINGEQYISIGNDVRIKPRLQMEAIFSHLGKQYNPKIIIGNNVSINYDVHIAAINEILIDDNVLIASKVFITDHSHGNTDESTLEIEPSKRNLFSKGPVHIEKNVWIGENSIILPGVTVGRNSVIGANSVVTKDVNPFSIVAGSPAQEIRHFDIFDHYDD